MRTPFLAEVLIGLQIVEIHVGGCQAFYCLISYKAVCFRRVICDSTGIGVCAFTGVNKTCFDLLGPVSVFLSFFTVTSVPHIASFRVSPRACRSIAIPRLG